MLAIKDDFSCYRDTIILLSNWVSKKKSHNTYIVYHLYRISRIIMHNKLRFFTTSEWRKCTTCRSLDGTYDSREATRRSGRGSFTRKSGGNHAASTGHQAFTDTSCQLPKG